MNSIEDILKAFNLKPYLVSMGANTVAKKLKCTKQEVVEARRLYRQSHKSIPKILLFDIETAPMKAYIWKRWKENISLDQTISEWFIICWSAKWLGSSEVFGDCLTPEESLKEDDSRVVKSLWKVLNEADIVISHNGKKFDIPKSNSRFIIHNLPPCTNYKQIDTLEVSKRVFGFSSNKLDALATYFKIPNKDETDFNLWRRCLEGDQQALDYMFKYNKKDVTILEAVYLQLRPWIPNHPNLNLYLEPNELKCPICGSTNFTKTGKFIYTNASKFELYRCNHCHALSRGRLNKYPQDKKKNLTITI